ncbi:vegetative cell wall protein gp1-like [Panicum virgatum]|uniref:vegetative cell wall protein gp1-like n=1 Tax=Panicum virgatum TaxID=38727 RepID=UPI0019D65FA2|nr:vegetative cell wall protein gp1-like [Panicum virgatum]
MRGPILQPARFPACPASRGPVRPELPLAQQPAEHAPRPCHRAPLAAAQRPASPTRSWPLPPTPLAHLSALLARSASARVLPLQPGPTRQLHPLAASPGPLARSVLLLPRSHNRPPAITAAIPAGLSLGAPPQDARGLPLFGPQPCASTIPPTRRHQSRPQTLARCATPCSVGPTICAAVSTPPRRTSGRQDSRTCYASAPRISPSFRSHEFSHASAGISPSLRRR